jgi:hypothetical protein
MPTKKDMEKIANYLLPPNEKVDVFSILTTFSEEHRKLACYGYYEKSGKVMKSPFTNPSMKYFLSEVSSCYTPLEQTWR